MDCHNPDAVTVKRIGDSELRALNTAENCYNAENSQSSEAQTNFAVGL